VILSITATTTDLQTYLGLTPLPDDPDRLLTRAAEAINWAVLGRTEGATDTVVDLVKQAICAQVEYWMQVDESVDVVGAPKSLRVFGSMDLTIDPNVIGPRARRYLLMSGLINRRVRAGGRWVLPPEFFNPYDRGRLL